MRKSDDIVLEPRKIRNHKPDSSLIYDTAVIGAGIAGFSAAMYSARLGMKTIVIGEMEGGTIALTGPVENYPGFVSITGQKLAELLKNHAMDYDVHIFTGIAETLKKTKGLFVIKTDGDDFRARTVILATGTQENKLGIPGEEQFLGKGVSYCALCDLTQAKGKAVAVIGGGDSAVKEAILLAANAKKVHIINNEEILHPEPHNMKNLQQLIKKGKVAVMNSTVITEITGSKRVEVLRFKDNKDVLRRLPVSWVFIYVGSKAKSKLAKDVRAKTNRKGEVMINRNSETSVHGFYAAGDVTDTDWKQAIMAAAQGVAAAYHAYGYLNKKR